jgi:hypothetical protein
MFENRVLRRILGPVRYEVTGGWRKLDNEELLGVYSSPNFVRVIKSRRMKWACHVLIMGEIRNPYTILVGKPEGKRLLGRPRRRWEDTVKMDLMEIGLGEWIGFMWRRVGTVAGSCEHGNEPSGSRKYGKFLY